MALPAQIQAFVEFYCFGPTKGNGKRSAIAAGVAPDQAQAMALDWLEWHDCKEYIKQFKRTAAEKVGIDVVWMLERFKEEFENCTTWEQLYDRKGNPVVQPHPDPKKAAEGVEIAVWCMRDPKAAAKFGEMIAKHLKMLTDKPDPTDQPGSKVMKYEPKTAEEASRNYKAYMESLQV